MNYSKKIDTGNSYPTYFIEWVKINLQPREINAGETNKDILKCKLCDNKWK